MCLYLVLHTFFNLRIKQTAFDTVPVRCLRVNNSLCFDWLDFLHGFKFTLYFIKIDKIDIIGVRMQTQVVIDLNTSPFIFTTTLFPLFSITLKNLIQKLCCLLFQYKYLNNPKKRFTHLIQTKKYYLHFW